MSLKTLSAGLSGLLFGVGLAISGMTQPAKVIAFLDVFGDWDPSLAFVMGGAILVHFVAVYFFYRGRRLSLLDLEFQVPTRRDISSPLVVGAALFGVGWGLAGFCPGPAIVSLPTAGPEVLILVAAMLAGMGLHALTTRASR